MASDLLLPATAALLDGWSGPVIVDLGTGDRLDAAVLSNGDVLLGRIDVFGEAPAYDYIDSEAALPDGFSLHLDLARAECRDRVARVVHDTAAHRSDSGGGLSVWYFDGAWHITRPVFRRGQTRGGLSAWDGRSRWRPLVPQHRTLIKAPGLAGLDPDDDRLLPDGSRWADAAALLAVAKEVLHGE